MPQALDRMRGYGGPDEAGLAGLVRAASTHAGPWPTIAIWHGTSDLTVNSVNADAIIAQWRTLHGVDETPSVSDNVDGHPHRAWLDDDGRTAIEDYRIVGLGHGTPLDTRSQDGCGTSAAYMLEADILSTQHIAHSWGLTDALPITQPKAARVAKPIRAKNLLPLTYDASGVGKVIEDALRSAGLMR